jgi:TolB protein
MNSDATDPKMLIADRTAQLRFASWSPDGKRLAFYTVRKDDEEIQKKHHMVNERLLYVMDAKGENQKRLLDFPIADFGWAPDSRRLYFISAYESPDRDLPEVINGTRSPLAYVYVLDTQTGAINRLPGSGLHCSASWSPDGARLAVTFGTKDDSGIHLITSDGGRSERLTDGSTMDFHPVWSPDGKSLAYISYSKTNTDAENSGVFVIAANGAGKKRASKETPSYIMWSPDSSTLLLQSASTARLIDPNGQKQVALSEETVLRTIMNATFAPTGKKVIFYSNDSGDWKIYSADLDGRKLKMITGKTQSSNFCLSPLLSRH